MKVHKEDASSRKLIHTLALCEDGLWRFACVPALSTHWKGVTCKRCLAKKPKRSKK